MKPQEKLNSLNPMNRPNGIRSPLGLGTMVQKIIHAGLNITPMPAAVRTAIKGCSSCRKRKNTLNRMAQNINPLAR